MKLKIILIGLLAIASLKSFAQDIKFSYDLAGNRTERVIVMPPPKSATASEDSSQFNAKETQEAEIEKYSEIIAEKQISIYPNPTLGNLAVEITNNDLSVNGSIQVFNMSGQLIQNLSTLTERNEVNLTCQVAGTYIMVIVIGNQKSEWKIIKQ